MRIKQVVSSLFLLLLSAAAWAGEPAGDNDIADGSTVRVAVELDKPDRDGNTSLHKAAEKGDTEQIGRLLAAKADLNAANRYGRTPLSMAVRNGHLDAVRLLVEAGASLARTEKADPPLWEAGAYRRFDCLRYLIEHKDDVNATDDSGRNLLHLAAAKGDEELAEIMLAAGTNPNAHSNDGETPLHRAAWKKQGVEVARLLLQAKADPNETADWHKRPIHIAIEQNNLEMIRLLAEARADLNAVRYKRLASGPKAKTKKKADEKEDKRPAYVQRLEDVKKGLLVWQGPSTPLDDALEMGDPETIAYLKSKRARQSPTPKKAKGESKVSVSSVSYSSIASAAAADDVAKVREFLKANPASLTGGNDKCPLGAAAQNGAMKATAFLLSQGAPVNGKNGGINGSSPLHLAVISSQSGTTRLLLEKGADPAQATPSSSPLHAAAQRGAIDCLRPLLAAMKPGATAIEATDIHNWARLLYVLRNRTDAGSSPAHEAVFKELEPELQARINSLKSYNSEPDEKLKADVLVALNHLLNQPDLHGPAAWRYRAIHPKGVALLEAAKQTPPTGEALRTLNRFLLESALPECLRKTQSNDVNLILTNGTTALHAAAEAGHRDAVAFLIEQGADVNARTMLRVTPLHLAASHGHPEAAQVLIEKGAEVDAVDSQQRTPLSLAAEEGYASVVRLLLEKGARVTTGRNGPLERARQHGRLAALRLLEAAAKE